MTLDLLILVILTNLMEDLQLLMNSQREFMHTMLQLMQMEIHSSHSLLEIRIDLKALMST